MSKKGKGTLKEAAKALKKARSVLLSCHERPDGDALGSCLGLAAALKAAGKKITVVNATDPLPGNLLYLPGTKNVRSEVPAGGTFDVAITTDSGGLNRLAWDLEGLRKSERVKCILNLDHHKDNQLFGDINYIDLKASSSAEVAYDVIEEAGFPVDKKVALNLFTGIVTDTGSFRYSNTTHKTMKIATHLMKFGIETFQVTEALEMSYPKERVSLMGKVLNTLEVSADGKWAAIFAPRAVMLAHGDRYDLLDEFVNFPRSIGSVEVAMIFKEVDNGNWRVSLRSKRYVDVGLIANHYSGGGHKFAAGCSARGNQNEVRGKIIKSVEEVLQKHA